jgi:hypothetical protein
LTDEGDTEVLEMSPDPAKTSLRILLIRSNNKLSAAAADPLAHVESSRIKPYIRAQTI